MRGQQAIVPESDTDLSLMTQQLQRTWRQPHGRGGVASLWTLPVGFRHLMPRHWAKSRESCLQGQVHNMWGPVQNENAGSLV